MSIYADLQFVYLTDKENSNGCMFDFYVTPVDAMMNYTKSEDWDPCHGEPKLYGMYRSGRLHRLHIIDPHIQKPENKQRELAARIVAGTHPEFRAFLGVGYIAAIDVDIAQPYTGLYTDKFSFLGEAIRYLVSTWSEKSPTSLWWDTLPEELITAIISTKNKGRTIGIFSKSSKGCAPLSDDPGLYIIEGPWMSQAAILGREKTLVIIAKRPVSLVVGDECCVYNWSPILDIYQRHENMGVTRVVNMDRHAEITVYSSPAGSEETDPLLRRGVQYLRTIGEKEFLPCHRTPTHQ